MSKSKKKPLVKLVTSDGKKSLIHENFLAEIAEVGTRHLRRMAGDGYFRKPKRCYYDLANAVEGLLYWARWGESPDNNEPPKWERGHSPEVLQAIEDELGPEEPEPEDDEDEIDPDEEEEKARKAKWQQIFEQDARERRERKQPPTPQQEYDEMKQREKDILKELDPK